MKTLVCLSSLALLVSVSAFAGHNDSDLASTLVCDTAPQPYNGGTHLTITTDGDGNNAVLRGSVSGGEAMFITAIGPVNVKISYEPGTIVYSNKAQDIELRVVETTEGGDVPTSATFEQGNRTLVMSCNAQ
jgi:hypothetical protein